MANNQYLSVSALTAYLKRKFDADPYLAQVYVTGEISNMGRRRGRHLYFSIKDPNGNAVISAAMFSYEKRLKFKPEEGMKINAIGRVQLYEPNGSYSIILEQMSPDGVGELFLAYEQLKKKLKQEGLFDLPKQAIPRFPKKIAVITSPTGAVIEDIARTVQRRYPSAQVVLFPAKVQGAGAAENVTAQILRIDATAEYDTLIVGRGGGSIEDLWAFNDETLARTIANANLPIISSVGHETDTTLADFVADRRAATPTAAAEIATPLTKQQIQERIYELKIRQINILRRHLAEKKQRIQRIKQHVIFQQPDRLYTGYNQRVDNLSQAIVRTMNQRVTYAQQAVTTMLNRERQLRQQLLKPSQERLHLASAKLDLVSPLKTLSRGYAIVSDQEKIVKSIDDLHVGEDVQVRLADGYAKTTIKLIEKEEIDGNTNI